MAPEADSCLSGSLEILADAGSVEKEKVALDMSCLLLDLGCVERNIVWPITARGKMT
jgi:hypothetical protein